MDDETDRDWLLRIFAERYGIDLNLPHRRRAIETLHGQDVDRILDAGWESDESIALRDRMADLLTRTANALKGEPGPLSSHDWSDLPEVAAEIVSRTGPSPGPGPGSC